MKQMWFWTLARVLDLGPGSLDSRQMFLPTGVVSSGCDQQKGEGSSSLVVLNPTHIPWAVSYLDVTAVLQPIPAFCQKPSIFTQPWLFRVQLRSVHLPAAKAAQPHRCSQLAGSGAALFPRALPPPHWAQARRLAISQVVAIPLPLSLRWTLLPFLSSALTLKVAHPGTGSNFGVAEKLRFLLLPPPVLCQSQKPPDCVPASPHLRGWCCHQTGQGSYSQNEEVLFCCPWTKQWSL